MGTKPIVVIMEYQLLGINRLVSEVQDQIDLRFADIYSFRQVFSRAQAEGEILAVGVGCISIGTGHPLGVFIGLVTEIREGLGFKGTIIGLCNICASAHLELGCDEVFGLDPFDSSSLSAGERFLQLATKKAAE